MSSEHVKLIAEYIQKNLGIVYGEANLFQLESRLKEIAKIFALSDLKDLWHKAVNENNYQIKQLLLDSATNNETSFFRDQNIFKAFEETMISELIQKNPGKPIRIWSAASSTGQEPYGLAMILDGLSVKKTLPTYEIFATDYSDRVLDRAREGIYTQLEVQRGLPTQLLVKYFKKSEKNKFNITDAWQIDEKLRGRVKFQKLNLLDPWSFGVFDIILCRNVLIYQNVENKKSIVKKISQSLIQGGYLIMGAAESLLGISNDFEQKMSHNAIYYVKK